MRNWLVDITGTNLAIIGMILISLTALVVGLIGILIAKDADTAKAALVIAGIAGTLGGMLGGFIGGVAIGKAQSTPPPPAPATE